MNFEKPIESMRKIDVVFVRSTVERVDGLLEDEKYSVIQLGLIDADFDKHQKHFFENMPISNKRIVFLTEGNRVLEHRSEFECEVIAKISS